VQETLLTYKTLREMTLLTYKTLREMKSSEGYDAVQDSTT